MKIFVINLKDKITRRTAVQEQADRLGLTIEFIDAVAGNSLSDDELQKCTYDYPACHLTKGEIGCALSHLKIYEKMTNENIGHALILEDDAVLSDSINEHIKNIIKSNNNKPNIYLLSKVESYFPRIIKNNLHRVYDASGAHAYIINKNAAQRILKEQTPIKYEADMWGAFRFKYSVNIYCTIPHLIDTHDENKEDSSLETSRDILKKKRESYRNKLKKEGLLYPYHRIIDLIYKKLNKPIVL